MGYSVSVNIYVGLLTKTACPHSSLIKHTEHNKMWKYDSLPANSERQRDD